MSPRFRPSRKALSVAMYFCLAALTGRAEQPVAADALVDSAGVNIHLHYTDTLYYLNFPLIESSLKELAIRHVRDCVADTKLLAFYARHRQLGADGIHAIFCTNPKDSKDLLLSWPGRVGSEFEGFEAPNESDQTGPNWVANLRAYLPLVYSAGKQLGVPVIGPSLTQARSYGELGNVSAYEDYANMHNYSGGQEPGTPGSWGGLGYADYGSIPNALRMVAVTSPARPVWTTEIGYTNDTKVPAAVPENVVALYLPRLFLMQWMNGVLRTYLYELLSSPKEDFGLLRSDGTKKPAFTAVASLLNLLKDPGPGFTPRPLDLAITGGGPTLRHMLLQKRDGTYYLAFWLERKSWDTSTRQPVSVAPVPITIHVKLAFASATVYRFDDAGQVTPREIGASRTVSGDPVFLGVRKKTGVAAHTEITLAAGAPLQILKFSRAATLR